MPSKAELNAAYNSLLDKAKQGGYVLWLKAFASEYTRIEFANHHKQFWNWIYAIDDNRPAPFIAIWPRGQGKSTSAELGVVNLACRGKRRYALYICATQDQADNHVSTIATLLESNPIARAYPDMSQRSIGKYGNVKGWRRNRLVTKDGFIIDALGLDVAVRGVKLDMQRPDLIVLDDIDSQQDSLVTINKKLETLSTAIIPSGANNLAVIGVQNLIHSESIFSQLADGRASMLYGKIISGPIKSLDNLVTESIDGRTVIVSGIPTWEGQSISRCQDMIDDMGISAFLSECQQETNNANGMFANVAFKHIDKDALPDLVRVVVAVDPAVTDTNHSDSTGISVAAIDGNKNVYILDARESKQDPYATITLGLQLAKQHGADTLIVETDQGGDTWKTIYKQAAKELTFFPKFKSEKAGSIGSKTHRASQMLTDYEKGQVYHVNGDFVSILENALRRFPLIKPFDLTDATYWAWRELKMARRGRMIVR